MQTIETQFTVNQRKRHGSSLESRDTNEGDDDIRRPQSSPAAGLSSTERERGARCFTNGSFALRREDWVWPREELAGSGGGAGREKGESPLPCLIGEICANITFKYMK